MPRAKQAKDSFFLRATVTTNDEHYAFTEIDLGPYVDVLGGSILRLWDISTQAAEADAMPWGPPGQKAMAWNLTTQENGELVNLDDKSVVASGSITTDFTSPVNIIDVLDVGPQSFRNGYLIATDSMYLSVTGVASLTAQCVFSVILECTVEKMSKEAGLALALSQQ